MTSFLVLLRDIRDEDDPMTVGAFVLLGPVLLMLWAVGAVGQWVLRKVWKP